MEENTMSAMLSDLSASENRFALWKERYQQYLTLVEQFHQRQEQLDLQLALYEEKKRMLQDMREDLMRERQQQAYRRASSLR